MIKMKPTHLLFIVLCISLVVFSGCNRTPDFGLEEIQGTLTLNGAPAVLMVIFESDEEISDLPAGFALSTPDGKFRMAGQSGLKAGKYRVRFSKREAFWKDSLKPVAAGEEAHRSQVVMAEALPEQFATKKSEIAFEVIKGKKNIFNYDVVVPEGYKPKVEKK